MTPVKACRYCAERQDRIELLEMQLWQVKKAVMPRLLFPIAWGLNHGETALLAALYTSPDGFRTSEMLATCLDVFKSRNMHDCNGVRIHSMRKKLRPYRIRIVTRHKEGYVLPPDSRRIIADALAKEV